MKSQEDLDIRLSEALWLAESKCPRCGDPDAYIGLRQVKCPNPVCTAFDQSMEQSLIAPQPQNVNVSIPHGEVERFLDLDAIYRLAGTVPNVTFTIDNWSIRVAGPAADLRRIESDVERTFNAGIDAHYRHPDNLFWKLF